MLEENHSTAIATESKSSREIAQPNRSAYLQPYHNGIYYPVSHRRTHARHWYIQQYLKRKKLRIAYKKFSHTQNTVNTHAIIPLAFLFLVFILSLVGTTVAAGSMFVATQQRYGSQELVLGDLLPKDSLKMYDSGGQIVYQMLNEGMQTTVAYSQISQSLVNAEVAIEDQYFWKTGSLNTGFDITGIIRAALSDVASQQIVAGGSTITQQLIKRTLVGNSDTITRKLEELLIAPVITRIYSKQQIMSMYLNTIYYGEQSYGADAAAFTYFDLQDSPQHSAASQLDIAQSAMLAGIPSAPTLRDPFLHLDAALIRQQEVLNQMHVLGYITLDQERAAILEAQQPDFLHKGIFANNAAPNFSSYALNELASELHVSISDLARAGLIVHTTLNLQLQNSILGIAQNVVGGLSAAHHMSNASEVLINYHNGDINVLLGSLHPDTDQFDVASQAYRQPGSAFKPFVYATAFMQGETPDTKILDAPYSIQMCCGLPAYTPQNYDFRYHGLVTIRYALQNSFNIPAVKTLVKVGVQNALHTAQVMGISTYEGTPNYTMVLGSLGVTLLEMTSAYGVFGNNGLRVPPHAITSVTDPEGNIIYQYNISGQQVIPANITQTMSNVLSDNAARTFEFGKCSMLYLFSNTQTQCYAGNPGLVRPSAVKTGTSNNFADNVTIGYTSDYVMGVWAGNNDNTPMVNIIGVDGAGPIWHDGMLLAEQGNAVHPLN